MALLVLAGSGCSSLLYHPTHFQHFVPEAFGLKAADVWIPVQSQRLHAWRLSPPGKAPLRGRVLFFHGNAENLTSHFASAAWLPHQGYEVVIFDYRGYGLSEGSPSPAATVEDGKAAIRHVLGESLAERTPVILFAQSLGGPILLRALEELGGEIPEGAVKLVAIESSFLSYEQAGASVLSRRWLTWPFQWLGYLLLSDRHAPAGRLSYAGPWLVMHGSADPTIEIQLGARLFDVLPGRKRWMEVPGGAHIQAFWKSEASGRFCYREEFLRLLEPSRPACLAPRARVPFEGRGEILQGSGGSFSHQGDQHHAIDFALAEGTRIRALRAGRVVGVQMDETAGGPDPALATRANFIRIQHDDGTYAEYLHLQPKSAEVSVGARVEAGQWLARSGNTGFSSSPHLHVRVYDSRGSMPIVFDEPVLYR